MQFEEDDGNHDLASESETEIWSICNSTKA